MTFTMKAYAELLQTKSIEFMQFTQLQRPQDDPLRTAVLSFNYFDINRKEIFFSPWPNS